ncbi:hypothetical protein [Vibrio phage Va2]|nr:hypothetical protein [Vibrio phage Va2]
MTETTNTQGASSFRKQLTDWAPVVTLVLLLITSGSGVYSYLEAREKSFYSYSEKREQRFYDRVDQMEKSFQARVDKSIGKLEGSISNYAKELERNRIEGDIRLLTYSPNPLTESQELLLEDLERQMDE